MKDPDFTRWELPSPQKVIKEWRSSSSPELLEITQKVWRGESQKEVWLLGRNEAAEILLSNGLSCAGVIDDFTTTRVWKGLPVQSFVEIAKRPAVIINTVANARPLEAFYRIKIAEQVIGLSFADFYRASFLREDALPSFSRRTHKVLLDNPNIYHSLWHDLRDETSRQTFLDILQFRLTTDPACMKNYRYRPEDQYFEPFLDLSASPVFIDAGAYHGETSIEFAKHYPTYKSIHAFEPSPANATVLKRDTEALPNLYLYRFGLSDSAEVVRFASQRGSASQVSYDGDTEVQMRRLDDLQLNQADLIKMDLEGGEYQALLGGLDTIRRCKARLAIGAYHDPEDFAKLHALMSNIYIRSSFYLRHYTSGWAETVLYCKPD